MTLVVLVGLFVVLLLMGTPIALAIFGGSIAALAHEGSLPGILAIQRMFVQMDAFSLLAIPLFILAGELMNKSGITNKLVNFAYSFVGHIRGGLAQVTVLASMLMAGISGSAVADCSAIGSVMMPSMRKEYDADYCVTTLACSSTIGPIIPPSVTFVIYGSVAAVSVGDLFLGGILPGILFGLVLMGLCYYFARKRGYKPGPKSTWKERGKHTVAALPAIFMPVIILGGILAGIFSPTEAGAVACLYAFIVGVVTKNIKLTDFKGHLQICFNAAIDTTVTMFIIGAAAIFGWLLAYEGFPSFIANFLAELGVNGVTFLVLCWVLYLILGLFMEGNASMIILTPVLAPIALSLGVDPIQFGVLTVVTLLLGCCTPPVGVLLYISANIARVKAETVFRLNWIYVGFLAIVALLLALIPALSTFIPHLVA